MRYKNKTKGIYTFTYMAASPAVVSGIRTGPSCEQVDKRPPRVIALLGRETERQALSLPCTATRCSTGSPTERLRSSAKPASDSRRTSSSRLAPEALSSLPSPSVVLRRENTRSSCSLAEYHTVERLSLPKQRATLSCHIGSAKKALTAPTLPLEEGVGGPSNVVHKVAHFRCPICPRGVSDHQKTSRSGSEHVWITSTLPRAGTSSNG